MASLNLVVGATNWFLGQFYTEGPVPTIFAVLLKMAIQTCLARKTTSRCSRQSTLYCDAPELYLSYGVNDSRVE